jgi:hypothetical protein
LGSGVTARRRNLPFSRYDTVTMPTAKSPIVSRLSR